VSKIYLDWYFRVAHFSLRYKFTRDAWEAGYRNAKGFCNFTADSNWLGNVGGFGLAR